MQRCEVEAIFEEKKSDLIVEYQTSTNPIAILLGGQPAAGKSNMAMIAEKEHINSSFIKINGDDFRIFHPKHDELTKDMANYSEKTQIFSNVFTEKLIEESIKNRFNVIVEGTMRKTEIPLKTAKMFKEAGYTVKAYVIAAPEQFTRLGLYNRYLQELQNKGFGRLADISLHDASVTGLLESINMLYQMKAVDGITINTFLAREKVMDYELKNGEWNFHLFPGNVIETSRKEQLKNKELMNEAEQLAKYISSKMKIQINI